MTNETINAIALDRAGSLWLGTDLGGVLRIAQGVMTTYAMADGLMASDVSQVVEDPSGRLYAVTLRRGLVHRFDGRRFHLVDLHLSQARGADRPAPGRRRDLPRWWLENGASKTLLAEPFDDNQKHVFAVFPDSRGDVWIGNTRRITTPWPVGDMRRRPCNDSKRVLTSPGSIPETPSTRPCRLPRTPMEASG